MPKGLEYRGVVGVELSGSAVANAERNASRNGLSEVTQFIAGDVAKVLRARPEIAADTDRDFYMDAAEAKEYGVVDDVLTKPPALDDEDE